MAKEQVIPNNIEVGTVLEETQTGQMAMVTEICLRNLTSGPQTGWAALVTIHGPGRYHVYTMEEMLDDIQTGHVRVLPFRATVKHIFPTDDLKEYRG